MQPENATSCLDSSHLTRTVKEFTINELIDFRVLLGTHYGCEVIWSRKCGVLFDYVCDGF